MLSKSYIININLRGGKGLVINTKTRISSLWLWRHLGTEDKRPSRQTVLLRSKPGNAQGLGIMGKLRWHFPHRVLGVESFTYSKVSYRYYIGRKTMFLSLSSSNTKEPFPETPPLNCCSQHHFLHQMCGCFPSYQPTSNSPDTNVVPSDSSQSWQSLPGVRQASCAKFSGAHAASMSDINRKSGPPMILTDWL